jgi:hypothetical protein
MARITPKKELYPLISEIISEKFRQTNTWVSRDQIIFELLRRPESSGVIETNWRRVLDDIERGRPYQSWQTNLEQYTGNWVDWFSARFDYENYGNLFQRAKDNNNNWMYRPK